MKTWIVKKWSYMAFGIYVIAVLLSTWLCWDWLTKESNSEQFRNIGLIVIALLGTPLAIWRTFIAKRNAEAQAKNVTINDRNSFTDTFTKAIEQLGARSGDQPNIEVRMGAIYALEKLSQTNSDYYQPIIDILAGYVRHNAPNNEIQKNLSDGLRIDIQTTLTVLTRRSKKYDEKPLDLSNTCLRGADFRQANLNEVYLRQTDLQEANLSNAILSKANLKGANLTAGNLQKADLWNAILDEACLKQTNFMEANMSNATLRKANLEEAVLIKVNLEGACLFNAVLDKANLHAAKLIAADLRKISCYKTNLKSVNLYRSDLSEAILDNAEGLKPNQLRRAGNWQLASRDPDLACDAEIPELT